MIAKVKIKKGDTVVVNAGKDKGLQGKVISVLVKDNRVVVEGVNVRTIHAKAKKQGQESGIIKREAPISVSNVNVVCAKCKKGVRTAVKVLENGTKVRVCKKCGEEIK